MQKSKRKALGIIVEYNPMHNGHYHHLNKAKDLIKPDVTIAAMSPQFVQRGAPALLSKYDRTKIALEAGVDIVLEIPTVHVLQRADVFAQAAVHILDCLQVDAIVYGSESNTEQTLTFDHSLIKKGASFAKASNQNSMGPNDLLGTLYKNFAKEKGITCHSIQRIGHYHDLDTNKSIMSASAIRNALESKLPYQHGLPYDLNQFEHFYFHDYLNFIKHSIIIQSPNALSQFQLMDEGIENLFKKNVHESDFVDSCISKRYTRSRIQRTLMNLYCGIKKGNYPLPQKARIVGLSQNGIDYLSQIKDQGRFTTQFSEYEYRDQELKFTQVYSLSKNVTIQKKLLQQELQFPIIKKTR